MKKHHIMRPMTWERMIELYGEGFFPEWQKKQVCKLKDKFFGVDSEFINRNESEHGEDEE